MKIIELGLKWVHMSGYGVILRLDRALWLTITWKTPLAQRRPYKLVKIQNRQKKLFFFLQGGHHKVDAPEVLSKVASPMHSMTLRFNSVAAMQVRR